MTFKKYLCRACGYVYDEALGDPDCGLPAGTRFEDIPDDWQCPLCGVTKADFEPLEVAIAKPSGGTPEQVGVVVVGAGLAGWAVVEALRAIDKALPITLITGDSGDRYHKPMLSLAFGQDKSPKDLIRQTGERASQDNSIHLMTDCFVISIDAKQQCLYTTQGAVSYDKLVLAIGSVPTYPPAISHTQAWHINHWSGFAKLHDRLTQKKHIAIIGAGMVGAELAEDLCRAGHQVTLVGRGTYPLSNLLPAQAGERLLSALVNFGIRFISDDVQGVAKTETGYRLCLGEEELLVDELVVAAGLGLDTRLPKSAGIDFDDKGIRVDSKTLATSDPHIFALGDCILIDGTPCRYIAPHRQQAAAIAHAITHTPSAGYTHTPPPIRLKNKSISLSMTGTPLGADNWTVVSDSDGKLVMEQYQNGQVSASLTLQMPSRPVP